jgi:uncharacterized repeat protein (TIGR03803 family)
MKLPVLRTIILSCVLCAMPSVGWSQDILTTLASFNGNTGSNPEALVQGFDGNFYGTALSGGAHDNGTLFKVTPAGELTTLYNFCSQTDCSDGAGPNSPLVQASNGNFYGTTSRTAFALNGTLFEITPAGQLTTLHIFKGRDGYYPQAGLVQGSDGNFYGTTEDGGAYESGNVFKMTPNGTVTNLHSFCSQANCTDGKFPIAGLIQAANGNFFGTTSLGGSNQNACAGISCGTIFEITSSGHLTTLHSFDGTDGFRPLATLVQATNGYFYGTTTEGGVYNRGTVFKIAPSGKLTTLHNFDYGAGAFPSAGLVQATDGSFYGTAQRGGANHVLGTRRLAGTVFEITSRAKLTVLYNFCSQPNCTDGFLPTATLLQATDGNFYGTTDSSGGTDLYGTVFSLGTGLGPFVKTLPTVGGVGASVIILGNNLSGTTSVAFNGTPATFVVVSNTEISATVPNGATTGKVEVTTPAGTLTTYVNFRVS